MSKQSGGCGCGRASSEVKIAALTTAMRGDSPTIATLQQHILHADALDGDDRHDAYEERVIWPLITQLSSDTGVNHALINRWVRQLRLVYDQHLPLARMRDDIHRVDRGIDRRAAVDLAARYATEREQHAAAEAHMYGRIITALRSPSGGRT